MIGQMAIAIALLGFKDLGRSVILSTIISTLSKNEQKINMGRLKKFKISVCEISNPAIMQLKLWSLNVNLFFEEPRQFTKFV